MISLKTQARVGWSWLGCGWRLYKKAKYRFAVMGFIFSALTGGLFLLPVLGPLLLSFVAPLLLSGWFLTAHEVTTHKETPQPQKKASKKNLTGPLLDIFMGIITDRIAVTLMVAILSFAISIVIFIGSSLIAGNLTWAGSNIAGTMRLALAGLIGIVLHVMLFIIVMHSLPQTLLTSVTLNESVLQSLKIGVKYFIAMAILLCSLLTVSLVSLMAKLGVLAAAITLIIWGITILPVTLNACYCSYRTCHPGQ